MSCTVVKEKTYPHGMKGQIVYDPDPQPYDGDTLGQIAYLESSRYTLGTESVSTERMGEIAEGIKDGTYIGLPIFAYVHGGSTIRAGSGFSCPWDSGQSGFVYVDRNRALSEFQSEKAAIECLKAEVRLFDSYLTGEVYGYQLLDEDDNVLDSCWGFYGDVEFKYMFECLDAAADEHLEGLVTEQEESDYWAARDSVTVD